MVYRANGLCYFLDANRMTENDLGSEYSEILLCVREPGPKYSFDLRQK